MEDMATTKKAGSFYADVIEILLSSQYPFMIGGAFALQQYTGIHRKTKDLDVFCFKKDFPKILQTLSDAGYKTELTDPSWIAKAYQGDDFVDFIFADPFGFYSVDETWLKHAPEAKVLGHIVRLIPPEEMLISKMYRQRRTKYEGPDVAHLILKKGPELDWERILKTMLPHWELLLAHILNFSFVYPSEKKKIPAWVVKKLLKLAEKQLTTPSKEKITRGLILSQKEYEIDVAEWGFKPETTKSINHD